MYEDKDLWPIKCFDCKEEFTEEIGRIKAGVRSRCPSCELSFPHPHEQFLLALTEARKEPPRPLREYGPVEQALVNRRKL